MGRIRHNAETFRWCYKRMGEFFPQLVEEGKNRALCSITRGPCSMACGRWRHTTCSTR